MSTPNHNHDITLGEDEDNDDFVMLDEPLNLAIRSKTQVASHPRVEFNSLPNENAFLISVQPPLKPTSEIKHVPCDIVLVIDVSSSMGQLAPLPDTQDEQERESVALTVLDLVRHASRTIISTLDEHDRLAIVTFSQDAQVVQTLINMSETAKSDVLEKIENLKEASATNLWAGIKTGIQQFEQNKPIGNVQGLFILTDGQPNYMCPVQGYIPKLEPLLDDLYSNHQSAPTIQTFGFGYSIKSDLMLSIAKAGNGNFAFIPEVGMIGTVFVHTVANLYATYATNAVLTVSVDPLYRGELQHESGLPVEKSVTNGLQIQLGNIIYGQSRDLIIHYTPGRMSNKASINTELTYTSSYLKADDKVTLTSTLGSQPRLSPSQLAYHLFRDKFCSLIKSIYPVDFRGQHVTILTAHVNARKSEFNSLARQLASILDLHDDQTLASLLSDLIGNELDPSTPLNGQVSQAWSTQPETKGARVYKSHWEKWGKHYLCSLWCAHMRQVCNSFKDPGPLQYGTNSEIFKRCRDELDSAFDNLPPPTGTYRGYDAFARIHPPTRIGNTTGRPTTTGASRPSVSMSSYNRSDNPCFLGSCSVILANGQITKVEDLRPGMTSPNPLTGRDTTIATIIKTLVTPGTQLCRVGADLWITPWHPIFNDKTKKWGFPSTIADETKTFNDSVAVYSILLHPSTEPDAHTIQIGGVPCVTLGHGILGSLVEGDTNGNEADVDTDVRAHPFFGDYGAVEKEAARLSCDNQMARLCSGMLRDEVSGLACGFVPEECA